MKTVKITQKSVSSFNQGNDPVFNDNYNIAKGWHTYLQNKLFVEVKRHYSGILGSKISLKLVREYVEIFPQVINEINGLKNKYNMLKDMITISL